MIINHPASFFENLIDNAWQQHHDFKSDRFHVPSSIPILYFGDLDKYFVSDFKIVTAARNPSFNEFPENNPWLRFPQIKKHGYKSIQQDTSLYKQCLSEYFRNKPYNNWFSHLDTLLREMNTNYDTDKNRAANTAVHTDIYSPLATNPIWSKLEKREQLCLYERGAALWRDLIEYLCPDIIIVPIGTVGVIEPLDEYRLTPISFPPDGYLQTIYTANCDKGFSVKAIKVKMNNHCEPWLVIACPGSKRRRWPFCIPSNEKNIIASKIINLLPS